MEAQRLIPDEATHVFICLLEADNDPGTSIRQKTLASVIKGSTHALPCQIVLTSCHRYSDAIFSLWWFRFSNLFPFSTSASIECSRTHFDFRKSFVDVWATSLVRLPSRTKQSDAKSLTSTIPRLDRHPKRFSDNVCCKLAGLKVVALFAFKSGI